MFEAQNLVFYSAISPVHMGAGQAVGAIDNPIQREVHTGHPLFAGSGLKGAVRHHLTRAWGDDALISRIFGPERSASEFAGAIAFTDAVLVAFPVRSLRNTYVYATCPTALARLKRVAGASAGWAVPQAVDGAARLSSAASSADQRLVLEAFDFEAGEDPQVRLVAEWLAANAFPAAEEYAFFRDKLRADLVLLSDTEFTHFARHATVVEPHVRINKDTGTADDGGLFYTENLPPESLLAGVVMATVERRRKGAAGDGLLDAGAVLEAVLGSGRGLCDRLLQVGGDASTGRGLVLVHPLREGT